MIRALVALIALPLFLIVAVASIPYYALVRLLTFLRLIPKEPAPTAVWWGIADSCVAEIAVPFTKPEIAGKVVAQILADVCTETGVDEVRHVFSGLDEYISCDNLGARFADVVQSIEYGTTAESAVLFSSERARVQIDWMAEQEMFIAMLEISTTTFDARSVMRRSLASVGGIVRVRRHPDGGSDSVES